MVLQAGTSLRFDLEANPLTACSKTTLQTEQDASWRMRRWKLLQMLSSAEERRCSESGGGLRHHGLLQHAPNTRVSVESSPQPPRPWGTLKWLWQCIGDLVPIHHHNLPFQQQLPASASPRDSAAPLFSAETFLGLPHYLFQN